MDGTTRAGELGLYTWSRGAGARAELGRGEAGKREARRTSEGATPKREAAVPVI